MGITVVNKYKEPNHIYIGRGSPLGNPFRMDNESQRGEVCDKYEEYFLKKVTSLVPDTTFVNEVNRLVKLAQTQDINLGCFCAPKRCHGDTIKNYITQVLKEK